MFLLVEGAISYLLTEGVSVVGIALVRFRIIYLAILCFDCMVPLTCNTKQDVATGCCTKKFVADCSYWLLVAKALVTPKVAAENL